MPLDPLDKAGTGANMPLDPLDNTVNAPLDPLPWVDKAGAGGIMPLEPLDNAGTGANMPLDRAAQAGWSMVGKPINCTPAVSDMRTMFRSSACRVGPRGGFTI